MVAARHAAGKPQHQRGRRASGRPTRLRDGQRAGAVRHRRNRQPAAAAEVNPGGRIVAAAFAITHYAVIALLALCSYVIGRQLTLRLAFNSLAEEVAICTGLGLGAFAYLVL